MQTSAVEPCILAIVPTTESAEAFAKLAAARANLTDITKQLNEAHAQLPSGGQDGVNCMQSYRRSGKRLSAPLKLRRMNSLKPSNTFTTKSSLHWENRVKLKSVKKGANGMTLFCAQKTALLFAYSDAATAHSDAVAELRDRSGTIPKHEYDGLARIAKESTR